MTKLRSFGKTRIETDCYRQSRGDAPLKLIKSKGLISIQLRSSDNCASLKLEKSVALTQSIAKVSKSIHKERSFVTVKHSFN